MQELKIWGKTRIFKTLPMTWWSNQQRWLSKHADACYTKRQKVSHSRLVFGIGTQNRIMELHFNHRWCVSTFTLCKYMVLGLDTVQRVLLLVQYHVYNVMLSAALNLSIRPDLTATKPLQDQPELPTDYLFLTPITITWHRSIGKHAIRR
jgi:hypothetical protein